MKKLTFCLATLPKAGTRNRSVSDCDATDHFGTFCLEVASATGPVVATVALLAIREMIKI